MRESKPSRSTPESTPTDLVALADLLDSKFRGPFGVRVGWDGIIGLIPGFGDLATTVVSSYIIVRAALLGVSFSVLARMALNVVVDNGISMAPFFGWIGDFFWKSNLKNIDLIRQYQMEPERTRRHSTLLIVGVLFLIITTLLATGIVAGIIAWKVLQFVLSYFSA